MSYICFHSPRGDAMVHGSERAFVGCLCTDLALGITNLTHSETAERVASLLRPDHYMAGRKSHSSRLVVDPGWLQSMTTALKTTAFGDVLQWRGKPIAGLSLTLNTALVLGGDAVKLAARLHGQCEIHTYVEGPNRTWLADIIDTAVNQRVFRPGGGWDGVVTLLRSRDDEPMVTSYSVCESFPNAAIGDWLPPWPEGIPRRWDALTEEQQAAREEQRETWSENLDNEEQWRISLAGLRAGGYGTEMKPETWQSFRFRHKLSYLDLLAEDYVKRLDAASLSGKTEQEEWYESV